MRVYYVMFFLTLPLVHSLDWYKLPQHLVSPNTYVSYDFRGCYAKGTCLMVHDGSHVEKHHSKIATYTEDQSVFVDCHGKVHFDSPTLLDQNKDCFAHRVSTSKEYPPSSATFSHAPSVPDSMVSDYIAGIDAENLKRVVHYLSTTFFTRNAISREALQVARFLKQQGKGKGLPRCKVVFFSSRILSQLGVSHCGNHTSR